MATKKKDAVVKTSINVPGLDQVDLPDSPVSTGIDREDIVLPRIRLLQPVSSDVTDGIASAGQFMNSVTGEVFPEDLHVLIFTHFKSRVYFDPDGNGVLCLSPDGIEGSEFGACADCEYPKWKDRVPPPCALVHNYPCYVLNAGAIEGTPLPIALSFMKTSTKAARKLNTMVAVSHRSWFDFIFKVSSIKTKNDKGTYFVMEIEKLRDASEQERKLGYWAYQQFSGKNLEVADPSDKDGFNGKGDGKVPF